MLKAVKEASDEHKTSIDDITAKIESHVSKLESIINAQHSHSLMGGDGYNVLGKYSDGKGGIQRKTQGGLQTEHDQYGADVDRDQAFADNAKQARDQHNQAQSDAHGTSATENAQKIQEMQDEAKRLRDQAAEYGFGNEEHDATVTVDENGHTFHGESGKEYKKEGKHTWVDENAMKAEDQGKNRRLAGLEHRLHKAEERNGWY